MDYIAIMDISRNRNNKTEINKIVSSTIISRLILGGISFIIFITQLFTIDIFSSEKLFYLLLFTTIFEPILNPSYLFIGFENFKANSFIYIINRIIFIILIFLLIKNSNDYILYAGIFAVSYLIHILLSQILILKKYKIKYVKPELKLIKRNFKKGSSLFSVRIAETIFRTSNILILGLLTQNVTVGFFNAAYTVVISVIVIVVYPIIEVAYPRINKILSENEAKSGIFFRKIISIIIIFGIFISFSLYFFSDLIIQILVGNEYSNSITILRSISFLPLIIGISRSLMFLLLIPNGFESDSTKIIIISSLFFIIADVIMISMFDVIGHSIVLNLTELVLLILSIYFVYRRKIHIFKTKNCKNSTK